MAELRELITSGGSPSPKSAAAQRDLARDLGMAHDAINPNQFDGSESVFGNPAAGRRPTTRYDPAGGADQRVAGLEALPPRQQPAAPAASSGRSAVRGGVATVRRGHSDSPAR